jgi:L-lactate dehydrogenase complex protein LldF
LYKWRQVIVKEGYGDRKKAAGMHVMDWTLASPTLFNLAGKAGRWVLKHAPFAVNNSTNPWYKHRDMPAPPQASFTEWFKTNRSK